MCTGIHVHKTTDHLIPKDFVYLPDFLKCVLGIVL